MSRPLAPVRLFRAVMALPPRGPLGERAAQAAPHGMDQAGSNVGFESFEGTWRMKRGHCGRELKASPSRSNEDQPGGRRPRAGGKRSLVPVDSQWGTVEVFGTF